MFCKQLIIDTVLRLLSALLIGGIIGSERAHHGRAAGMRTHILVSLGACMTALTSLYVSAYTGVEGDVFRISAQVVSGVGFLGAGMIILRNNNMITGLTTAAGVWTTATIGIALGYGYYVGAFIVTPFFLVTITVFSKLERNRKSHSLIYVEIDNPYELNTVIETLKNSVTQKFSYHISAPKSNINGNIGVNIVFGGESDVEKTDILKINHIVFAVEE